MDWVDTTIAINVNICQSFVCLNQKDKQSSSHKEVCFFKFFLLILVGYVSPHLEIFQEFANGPRTICHSRQSSYPLDKIFDQGWAYGSEILRKRNLEVEISCSILRVPMNYTDPKVYIFEGECWTGRWAANITKLNSSLKGVNLVLDIPLSCRAYVGLKGQDLPQAKSIEIFMLRSMCLHGFMTSGTVMHN